MRPLVTILALAALATPALAENFWVENFNYPAGGLVANSGGNWVTHSGTGTDIQVSAGAYAVGIMSNAPSDHRNFPTRGVNDKTYACFKVRLPALGGLGDNYFAHFMDAGTNFRVKVYAMSSLLMPEWGWALGITVAANGLTATPRTWPSPPTGAVWEGLAPGWWYTVVIDYDAAAGTADLWVDPVNELSPHISVSDTSVAGVLKHTPISAFALRQGNTKVDDRYWVDDIGVGTSFEDACKAPTPTLPSTWGQLEGIYR